MVAVHPEAIVPAEVVEVGEYVLDVRTVSLRALKAVSGERIDGTTLCHFHLADRDEKRRARKVQSQLPQDVRGSENFIDVIHEADASCSVCGARPL